MIRIQAGCREEASRSKSEASISTYDRRWNAHGIEYMLVEYDHYDGEDGMAEHRQQDGSVDGALDESENQRPSVFHSFIYALELGV